jgi:hypothetical protein
VPDLDDLPDEDPEPVRAELVPDIVHAISPAKTEREHRLDRIRDIEDDLLISSIQVTQAAINFAELPEDAEGYPLEWERELGREGAERRFRQTKAGWKSSRDAPVGVILASNTAKAIIKARAAEKQAPRALAIMFLPAPDAPRPVFEVVDVESE